MLPAEVQRHRFTVEEYHRMGETGLLSEDDRVELIDGKILEMAAIGWHHANCVNDLTKLLVRFSGGRYVVSVQNPLTISAYGEPNLTCRPEHDFVASALPRPFTKAP